MSVYPLVCMVYFDMLTATCLLLTAMYSIRSHLTAVMYQEHPYSWKDVYSLLSSQLCHSSENINHLQKKYWCNKSLFRANHPFIRWVCKWKHLLLSWFTAMKPSFLSQWVLSSWQYIYQCFTAQVLKVWGHPVLHLYYESDSERMSRNGIWWRKSDTVCQGTYPRSTSRGTNWQDSQDSRQTFTLDRRMEMDISFGDKKLKTKVYVKMNAYDQRV